MVRMVALGFVPCKTWVQITRNKNKMFIMLLIFFTHKKCLTKLMWRWNLKKH